MWNPVKHIWKHIALVLLAGVIVVVTYMIGCSHTSFEDMGALCDAVEDRNGTCTPIHLSDDPVLPDDPDPEPSAPPDPSDPPDSAPAAPRTSRVETTYTVQLGQVDIIFVVDNSGSMSREHRSLGKQMKSFLRRIKNLDYRVAVITTDISASPGNPNRGQSFQDGNFIKIAGKDWLENSEIGKSPDSADISAFLSALIRPETERCDEQREGGDEGDPCGECISRYGESDRCDTFCDESFSSGVAGQCVSSDERGIYALNLALEKRPDFHRPDAHLMIVILSDEDERSSQEWMEANGYDLEDKDRPLTLVETVYHRLGGFKTFNVYAIIVPPGAEGDRCLDEQNRDRRAGGRGYKGEEYARLARAREAELIQYGNLLRGKVISICNRSYAGQLGQVELYASVPRVSIGCADPLRVRFFQNGQKLDLSYEVEEGGKSLAITDSVSISSHLEVKVVCEVAL